MTTALDKFRGIGVALGIVRAPEKPKEDPPEVKRLKRILPRMPMEATAGFQDPWNKAGGQSQIEFDPETGTFEAKHAMGAGYNVDDDEFPQMRVDIGAEMRDQRDWKSGDLIHRAMKVQMQIGEGDTAAIGYASSSRGVRRLPPEKPVAAKGGKKH